MDEIDIITSPLSTVKQLCEQDATIVNRLKDVGEYFKVKLNGQESKLPWINHIPLENIRPNSLVRFRGMIQDMFDPEFYLGMYSVTDTATKQREKRFGCYTDPVEKQNEEIDFENVSNVTLERQTYYCVPVPGENEWLNEMFTSNSTYVADTGVSLGPKKRSHGNGCNNINEDSEMDVDGDMNHSQEKKCKQDGESDGVASKRKKVEDNKFDRNNPLPNTIGTTCFITMYSDISELKLNEVAEFICIFDSHHSKLIETRDDMDSMTIDTNVQSPFIPRLHCLFFNKFSTLNPEINMKSVLYEKTLTELTVIRNELMQLLSNVFGGDATVAEYFLLHLISSTYAVVGVLCVGKISLNITNCKCEGFPQTLYKLVQKIVEKSFYLPLTTENLNKMKFTPKKDYEANKLVSGVLQLASDTNLILDETAMQPGKLDADGVNNLKAVGNLIQWQNVEYDFKFSKVNMNTKVNVLILSEGKSMLTCDCRIPIATKELNNEKAVLLVENISPSLLEKIRIYLYVVRSLEYTLTEEVSKALEEDFVEMRKLDAKAASVDSFSLLLTTARFMALSYGQGTLDAPLWTRTKDLDKERRKREV